MKEPKEFSTEDQLRYRRDLDIGLISEDLGLPPGPAHLLRKFVSQLSELHDAKENVQLGIGIDEDLHNVCDCSDQLVVIANSIAKYYRSSAMRNVKHLADRLDL